MADQTAPTPRILTPTAAVGLMLVAYALFSVVDTSTKWLLGAGYVAVQLAFMRYAVQFMITSARFATIGTGPLRRARPLFPILILRAMMLIIATVVNFFALNYLSLAVASAIMFTAPIIVCALSWPVLGERVGPFRVVAIAVGFLGVLAVIRPFSVEWNWAAALMLIPATGLALYSIITRKLAGDVDAQTMQFVLGLTGTVVILPFALLNWTWPTAPLELVLMCALGACAWLGHEFLIRAHRDAEANLLMPYTYSYLIYMTFAGFLVFGDVPDVWTLFGALLICGAGLAIWWRTART